jgi:hypothetical protein
MRRLLRAVLRGLRRALAQRGYARVCPAADAARDGQGSPGRSSLAGQSFGSGRGGGDAGVSLLVSSSRCMGHQCTACGRLWALRVVNLSTGQVWHAANAPPSVAPSEPRWQQRRPDRRDPACDPAPGCPRRAFRVRDVSAPRRRRSDTLAYPAGSRSVDLVIARIRRTRRSARFYVRLCPACHRPWSLTVVEHPAGRVLLCTRCSAVRAWARGE